MIAFVSAASPTFGVLSAAAAYVLVGAGVGVALRRRDAEAATAWSALVVWPLLLPVLLGDAGAPTGQGPLAPRIAAAFGALERALPPGHDPSWAADLSGLRRALGAADERLLAVDRLLADTPGDADEATRAEATALRDARDRASAEVLDVLAALERLRLQLGRMLLAGEGARVGDHLRQLRARVAALGEVGL